MPAWSKVFSTSALLSLARVAGAGVGFLTQIALARLLQPDDLGLFYSVTSIAPIVSLVVALGYPNIMTRFVSRYRERGQRGHEAAFIGRARRDALFWAVASMIAISAAALLVPGFDPATRWAVVLTAVTVVPYSSQRVLSAIAMAYRHFAVSHMPGMTLRPMLFAAALAAVWAFALPVTVVLLTSLTLATVTLTGLIQYALLRRTLGRLAKPSESRRLVRRWRSESWPLIMVAAFTGLLSDLAIVVSTPFIDLSEVGALGVCLKIAFLVGFAVQAAHQVILPDLGDAMARRERGGMSTKLLSASLFPILVTTAAIALSAMAGDRLLAVFGEEFSAAQDTLTILLVAQLVRAVAGPSPFILTLRGAQRISAAICAASAVLLVAGNALLGPLWGAEGAAIALLGTTIFWLGATAIALHRNGGTRADLAGLLLSRRAAATAGE